MQDTAVKLEFSVSENKGCGIPVIIVAAGKSSRMNGIDKQMLSLCGIPVIIRTLKKFEASNDISRIILVTREELINEIQILSEKYMITKLTDIVSGGADRGASVVCGLARLCENEDKVLIHDGARPFVTSQMIHECAKALDGFDGAVCAVKINDTVKKVSAEGTVETTLDRSYLYAAQTPQGVRVPCYKKALDVVKDISRFTDDASILESAGYSVKLVEGSAENIKITTVSDIAVAEAFIGRQ